MIETQGSEIEAGLDDTTIPVGKSGELKPGSIVSARKGVTVDFTREGR